LHHDRLKDAMLPNVLRELVEPTTSSASVRGSASGKESVDAVDVASSKSSCSPFDSIHGMRLGTSCRGSSLRDRAGTNRPQRLFAASCRALPAWPCERNEVFDGILNRCRWVEVFYAWRPNFPDVADNHLIELAVAAQADAIVMQNLRDASRGELKFPSLRVLAPEQLRCQSALRDTGQLAATPSAH
jgi:hypothetical protein